MACYEFHTSMLRLILGMFKEICLEGLGSAVLEPRNVEMTVLPCGACAQASVFNGTSSH